MEGNNRSVCSHSLPNLDSTINSTKQSTIMVTYPISEEDQEIDHQEKQRQQLPQGIANKAYEEDDDYDDPGHNQPSRPSSSTLHHPHYLNHQHHQHQSHPAHSLHPTHHQQLSSLSKTKSLSDQEYLCHPGSSSSSTGQLHPHHQLLSSSPVPPSSLLQPTVTHHSRPIGSTTNRPVTTSNGNLETNLGSRLFSTGSCDFDVVPVFTLNNHKRSFTSQRISRTTRIIVSTSLISFGITIMIVGILVYTVRDIEIGFNPYTINKQANTTTPYEAFLVHQTVDSIINDERRYNASVGSMFMSFGALAVIIGISLLLAPAIKRKQQLLTPIGQTNGGNVNVAGNKKVSSIVYFNKDDLDRSQLSVEKIDLDLHGSRKEFF